MKKGGLLFLLILLFSAQLCAETKKKLCYGEEKTIDMTLDNLERLAMERKKLARDMNRVLSELQIAPGHCEASNLNEISQAIPLILAANEDYPRVEVELRTAAKYLYSVRHCMDFKERDRTMTVVVSMKAKNKDFSEPLERLKNSVGQFLTQCSVINVPDGNAQTILEGSIFNH